MIIYGSEEDLGHGHGVWTCGLEDRSILNYLPRGERAVSTSDFPWGRTKDWKVGSMLGGSDKFWAPSTAGALPLFSQGWVPFSGPFLLSSSSGAGTGSEERGLSTGLVLPCGAPSGCHWPVISCPVIEVSSLTGSQDLCLRCRHSA